MKILKFEAMPGDVFSDVAKEAKGMATDGKTVEFDFNGIKCLVDSETNLEWLYRDYCHAGTMDWKTIGPDCAEAYPVDVQEEYKKRKAQQEKEWAEKYAGWKELDDASREAFEKKTEGIKIELASPEAWAAFRESNQDGYGKAAIDYAEAWAKLMQIEIGKGKTVAECYEYTQNEIGFFNITGFQFGCAVSILVQSWKYGEELKARHYGDRAQSVAVEAVKSVQEVGHQFTFYDSTLTAAAFFGKTGIEYNTAVEAIENNPGDRMICVKNKEHGGTTELNLSFSI